jgi:SAM-dependent methyltransferase
VSEALTAPAVARNRDHILAVLRRVLPAQGTVLEIASGSGEHAVHFAGALSDITWQPTDQDAAALRSIAAWRESARLPNLLAPLELDVPRAWPIARADAIVCINMIHISPWRSSEALMAGAATVLSPDGVLFLYGPYKEGGVHTAPSNEAFDASLRARNPEWGVRDLDDVKALAAGNGLQFVERVAMPANNLSVVFRRS